MNYSFDQIINRQGTASVKTDEVKEILGREDLIPLWVADMDFATPPFVLDAIRKRCEHPILGYTCKPDSYYQAIIGWMKMRYHMEVRKEQLNYVPGIVPGLGMAINALTQPGDKIMIMPPVYPPFFWLVTRNNRRLVECPLRLEDGHYRMDLDLFRRSIKGVRALILCNPHNPGGIVWTREELETIAEVCADDNVIVLSDEIHADLTLPPRQHLPFPMVSEKARNNSVTFMSPSKAFNMPGVSASHTVIFNEGLRARFEAYLESCELNGGHVFAFPAVEAAYSNGTEWLEQLLSYIQGNIDYVTDYIHTHMPKIKVIVPMASYLVWLDCRDLKLSQEALNDWFVSKAHLALNDGKTFGKEGIGFMRMNIGSPRSILEQAMKQLHSAYQQLPE